MCVSLCHMYVNLALAAKEINLILLPGNYVCHERAVRTSLKHAVKCCIEEQGLFVKNVLS